MFSLILIRITDILISIIFIIIFSPIIIVIIFLIIILEKHSIIFISSRVGKKGKIFKIYKFQTMLNNNITNLGFYLRRMSLDEIPQLFNVLKGDMSIVGPRPLPEIIEYDITLKHRELRRKIRPGITGLAQIYYSGKKRTLEEKTNLDLYYINNISYFKYLNVIIMTFPTLIRRFIYNKTGKTL